jgi:hypothetical protein
MKEVDRKAAKTMWMEFAKKRAHLDFACTVDNV